MYEGYFGLTERPFSIAPDPQYLYMSSRHKEAMAHLSYGLSQGGCFIVLTGEVGTGKTTLCRNLLGDLPDNVDVALILNANINETELLQTICDELKISYSQDNSQKQLLDAINQHLLATFAENRHTVLIIDEAQLLSRDVLEQIRLLTNLETTKNKLLQIILIGQPELNQLLGRNDLRQLAQRVTARYHLSALRRNEIEEYVNFRLSVAGCKQPLFSRQALSKIHRFTSGIPRKINVLADHALLAAYSKNQRVVDSGTVKSAAKEVFVSPNRQRSDNQNNQSLERSDHVKWLALAACLLLLNIGLWLYFVADKEVGKEGRVSKGSSVQLAPQNAAVDLVSDVVDKVDEKGTTNPISSEASAVTSAEPEVADSADEIVINTQTETTVEAKLESLIEQTSVDVNETASQADITPGSVIFSNELLDDEQIDTAGSQTNSQQNETQGTVVAETFDENTEFGQVLETSADLTGRISAMRSLASLWKVALPDQMIKAPCQELQQQGLRCQGVSNWMQLRRYNRPTILVLKHLDQLHRVIVTSMDNQSATLSVDGTPKVVSLDELQSRWTGNALLFWKPAVGVEFLELEDQNAVIPAVRRYLNRALAQARLPILNSVDSDQFDIDMSQKIFALQSTHDIISDSKIGNETYLLMNELVLPNTTPVLTKRTQ